ncbi:cation-translocating P-type ATPase [Vibrio sp. WXL103]|uniref:cation-translocating P-type ATPase n=1 Tax=Vibrio sp. WXL103 TaxID=3450710 RepID=UPI003EC8B58C
MNNNWYALDSSEVVDELKVDVKQGLSPRQVEPRERTFGRNEITTSKQQSLWSLYLEQYKNPLVYILVIGTVVSWLTGHYIDAIAIGVIILINTGISFWQEYKAKKGMEALQQMAAPQAEVRRSGEWVKIPAVELVPGDVVKISTGDILPADVRLIEAHNLAVDEAALTGESEPVQKSTPALERENVGLGDQVNMGFMTTKVTAGNGLGIVTAIGMETEVGHIADMLNSTEETRSPMQVRMDTLAKLLLIAGLSVVAMICVIGYNHGLSWLEILTTGISLSVAAIPEGLPTVLTIVLTMGSSKMAKQNALAKHLSAIETLGSTTVICSDKTGTLTQNQMQATQAFDASGMFWDITGNGFEPIGNFVAQNGIRKVEQCEIMSTALIVSTLCNDAELNAKDGHWSVNGSPTSGALLVAAKKTGITQDSLIEKAGYILVRKLPFDSTRKLGSAIVRDPSGRYFLATAGAPDVMLKKSRISESHQQQVIRPLPMTKDAPQLEAYQQVPAARVCFEKAVETFAQDALRTLAVGYRYLDVSEIDLDVAELENDLTILSVFGIMDPPRPEVKEAIEECHDAGLKTVMITGDHAATATAIAKEIGIIRNRDDKVLTGEELDKMTDYDLEQICPQIAVYARVTPEHKLRIVRAQQANNEVAAMTGDGVNDAPALRAADIGVAMGITGTSVAKDSGDLILLDDDFSTIVVAVRQGRKIYDNLRKFIRQALTANVGEVSVILFAFLLMGPEAILPLTPLMILWVNLISDGIPALALGMEPEERNVMKRKPRKRDQGFFSNGLGAQIITRGLALGGLSYCVFYSMLQNQYSAEYAQTAAFMTLIFGQLWHLFDSRSLTTLFRIRPFTNKYLLAAIALSSTLSLGVIYTELGQWIFSTEALKIEHLIAIVLGAALPTFALSAIKEFTKVKFL